MSPLRNYLYLAFALGTLTLVGCTQKKQQRDDNQYAQGQQNSKAPITDDSTATPDTESPNQLGSDARIASAAVLPRGHDMLKARLWMLSNAKRSVRVQAFLFKGDEVGSYIANKLIALHQQGLKVAVNVDEVINFDLKAQILYARMAKEGIPIEGFNPGYLQFLDNITAKSAEDLAKENNKRYHDKMFIVDAEDKTNGFAIMGGANVGNEYFEFSGGNPNDNWQDQDVIVRGPIVADLMEAFDTNQKIMQQSSNTSSSTLGSLLNTLNKTLNLNQPLEKLLKLRTTMLDDIARIDNQEPTLDWRENVPMTFIHSRPRLGEDKIFPAYLDQIAKAQTSIDILNSYFIPTQPLQKALIDAANRGVKIRILTNSPQTGDVSAVQLASRSLYFNLLGATDVPTNNPIKIYEWGGEPEFKNGFTLHHAKFAVFDQERSIVGSFNLDPRSQFLNSETVILIQNKAMSKTLESFFEHDIGPGFGRLVTNEQAKQWYQANALLDLMAKQFGVDFHRML